MVPQDGATQPIPVMLHVTAVLLVPVTVAVNCCCAPVFTEMLFGATVTAIGIGEVIVTVAEPDMVGYASNVAVTATSGGLGTLAGAVYRPLLVTVPHARPVQPLPDTLQITTVLLVPVTVAVNCVCFPVCTCALAGETVTAGAA